MADYKKDAYPYISSSGKGDNEEAEIAVDAVPAAYDDDYATTGPPIAPGHQRFYCEKCRAVRGT